MLQLALCHSAAIGDPLVAWQRKISERRWCFSLQTLTPSLIRYVLLSRGLELGHGTLFLELKSGICQDGWLEEN
jgi:hypothetical protein